MSKLQYVNVKQGTASVRRFSGGNTLPLTQLPFGMAAFAPQTISNAEWWFYHPDHRSLEGVRLTHQPSPWIGDYGTFLMTPQVSTPKDNAEQFWSAYRPQEAVNRPDYMSVRFLRTRCTFETTPTTRGAYIRLKLDDTTRASWLSFSRVKGDFEARVVDARHIVCSSNGHDLGQAKNFRTYFVVEFADDVCDVEKSTVTETAVHAALLKYEFEAQIAISYVSEEQAWRNLAQDKVENFDAAWANATKVWEDRLALIDVETETEEEMKTFYTCLYRTFVYPHKAYEIDENGENIHYCPENGEILKGRRYTDNGFWDTYRTVYPLYSILCPDEYREILDGYVQDYRDFGWLPRWTSMAGIDCMPSTLIDAVIADAAVKGIADGELLETAFEGMLKHATVTSPQRCYGRNGVKEYLELGYVPYDVEHQSVNLTQDAAYGDFCIAEIAKILGKPEIEAEYRKRAKNYANVFDPKYGLMRGRDSQGNMRETFDSFLWGGDYTEGSAWQNSFGVPHDIDGLAELYGGKEKMMEKIDELFATPPYYCADNYGAEIHEMTELAALDYGQCAISNQPSFPIPYIYAMLGCPEKSSYWVKRLCKETFSSNPFGFPGDEDNGTTAAWYIFGMLGFYPFCPGKAEYVNLGEMSVKRAAICGKEWDPAKEPAFIPHDRFAK